MKKDTLRSKETEALEKALAGYIMFHGVDGIAPSRLIDPNELSLPWVRAAYEISGSLRWSGRVATMVSISEEVRQRGLQSRFGLGSDWERWPAYADSTCPTLAQAEDCLERIHEIYIERKRQEVGTLLAAGEITGADAVDRLNALGRPKSELPAIVDAADLLTKPPAVPDELVEGLLHRGAKLVLGGGSKSFKTWSLLDLALSVASGSEFWGFPCRKGKVLYLNFEIQAAFFARRMAEILVAKGRKIDRGVLQVLNLRGFAAEAEIVLPKIQREIEGRDYSLLILDPIYKLAAGKDENAAQDMGQLMNAIERLAVNTGAAVAFGHHFSKGNQAGKESIDRASGSGVFARDPDSIVTMTKHEEDDAFTVEMTLRNHAPQEAFVVRRNHPLMVRDDQLDPTKLKQVIGRKRENDPEDIIRYLGEGMSTADWQKACEEEGIPRRTFYRLKKQLETQRLISKSGVDGSWLKAR